MHSHEVWNQEAVLHMHAHTHKHTQMVRVSPVNTCTERVGLQTETHVHTQPVSAITHAQPTSVGLDTGRHTQN